MKLIQQIDINIKKIKLPVKLAVSKSCSFLPPKKFLSKFKRKKKRTVDNPQVCRRCVFLWIKDQSAGDPVFKDRLASLYRHKQRLGLRIPATRTPKFVDSDESEQNAITIIHCYWCHYGKAWQLTH